ncbi:MAG: family 10 glycosylhydrolase [Lentisphaerae bacterium]|jgi:hypothetical protein|nr:family 10 glycosylhydrolase [Lentisphaerota bacterium]MBT4814698.1 family 10 glycosylhydrolase [Lentisphaerota bacterium]MBT5613114.1 family 10 glycosylhydrolase [Lentisphaerota bacterium]MBT7061993.1 family 10 glycosylhydrolase [Lentisphaerota bacterium]MBT7844443.1 family 10 glycosylhydrolase [Lentisphaerota bacterium]
MRCLMPFTVLLVSVLALSAGGSDFRKVPIAGVGFIGPSDVPVRPETSVCRHFGYQASVGFPYRNRSLAVDFGRPVLVHRLQLLDDYSDHGGTSPSIAKHGLGIYTSQDGRTYERCTLPFTITIRSGEAEGAFDLVEIDGLALVARYVKFHQALPDSEWDLGNNNLQNMVRAYQDADLAGAIETVVVPRYSAGHALLRATVTVPRVGAEGLSLDISDSLGQPLAAIPVPADGVCSGDLGVGGLPQGLHTLRVRAFLPGRVPVAEAEIRTYVCARIVADPEEDVVGAPGQVVMLSDIARDVPDGWEKSPFRRQGDVVDRVLVSSGKGASEMTVKLPASGWHAVSIGLTGDGEVDARLGKQGDWRRCRLEVWRQHAKRTGLGEAFVGCAELDRTTLHIRPRGKASARIAFVRLLGLSEEQISRVLTARKPNTRRRVTVNNDGYSMFFSGVNSIERIHRMIDRYEGKELYSYDYCLGTDASCTYDTKVGTVYGTGLTEFWRQGDRRAAEGVRKLISEGNDPLRVVIERCRKNGLRVNTSFRMNACYPLPMGKTFNGKHYWEHYDSCRVMTRYGKPHTNLSYAYPGVRAYRLAVIREAATYAPDGMHLDFLRHPPFTGNDGPIAETFRKRHGEEPPTAPFADPRWQVIRTEVMTEFVRDVRRALDDVGRELKRRLPLSVSFDCVAYQSQGLDVKRWVTDGLVDNISPGIHGHGGTHFGIAEFAKMTQGTPCELFVRLEHTIQGHDPTPESERGEVVFKSEHMTLNLYRARVLELYERGADGIYLFNTGGVWLIDVLSDEPGLRAWDAVERPLVGWFDFLQ